MSLKTVLALLVLASLLYAQNVTIASSSATPPAAFTGEILAVKTAPESVQAGEVFSVSIMLTNNGSASAAVEVNEFLGNVEPVEPQPVYADVGDGSILAALPPMLSWSFDLPAGASKEVSYKIKPKTVGVIAIGPTEVIVQGEKFYSNPLSVQVECSQAPSCDESIGETASNCPAKCGLGANATLPEAPQLTEIPTAPIPSPVVPNLTAVNATQAAPVQPQPICPLLPAVMVLVLAGLWASRTGR